MALADESNIFFTEILICWICAKSVPLRWSVWRMNSLPRRCVIASARKAWNSKHLLFRSLHIDQIPAANKMPNPLSSKRMGLSNLHSFHSTVCDCENSLRWSSTWYFNHTFLVNPHCRKEQMVRCLQSWITKSAVCWTLPSVFHKISFGLYFSKIAQEQEKFHLLWYVDCPNNFANV